MKRLFLILVIVIGYLSAFSQEKGINQIRYENFKKLNTGMYPDEIVSLLSFETDINKSFFGGIFIGIGLLSKDSQTPSSYTGSLNLHEFIFIFDNGKLKEKSIDSTKIGLETISGKYIYEFIGKTQTSWSLVNGKFNSNTVAIEYTVEEKRKEAEIRQQKETYRKTRFPIILDSLKNSGLKIITETGFESIIVGRTTFEEVKAKYGTNYSILIKKKSAARIYYPDLGVYFYCGKGKDASGVIFEIKFNSQFKGVFARWSTYYTPFWLLDFNKTTKKNLEKNASTNRVEWSTHDNKEFVFTELEYTPYTPNIYKSFVISLEQPDYSFYQNANANEYKVNGMIISVKNWPYDY